MSLNPSNFASIASSVSVSNFPQNPNVTVVNSSLNVSDSSTQSKLATIQGLVSRSNKGTATLWNNTTTGVNGVSLSVALIISNQKNLSFFGNVSGATNLIVQFSNDGTTFYDSQYSYTQSASGDFGFNTTGSPLFCRIKSTNSVTATAFINYC